MHRITDDGLKSPDVERNLKILSRIAGDSALKNVIIVTTKWEQIAKEAALRGLLKQILPDQFKRHDGTKLSALNIIDSILKKTPELLRIQIELEADKDPASTTAGQELIEDINELITAKQAEDRQLRKDIANARKVKDKDKMKVLDAKLDKLGNILGRLKAEQDKLEAPVNWEQAEIDNTALDSAVKERHDLVTTDWKAKYDKLLVEYKVGVR
jgi:hypothetical protein